MLYKFSHPVNALSPILVTELGIITDVSEEQPSNALLPMLATEFGITTDVKEKHLRNALLPMLVTELGISADVSEVQPSFVAYVDNQYATLNMVEKSCYLFLEVAKECRFNCFNFI